MKLSLSLPVTPFHVNQGFGVNYVTYKQFGLNGHNGLDLMAYHGQKVYASHDGTVTIEIDENQGHGVVLLSDVMYDFDSGPAYVKTIYWHLCDPVKEPQYPYPVKNGQKVKRGDHIGYADNTGFSTGNHLHFGLKPVAIDEPAFLLENVAQNNGYLGAIDPTPYLNTTYSVDLPVDPTPTVQPSISKPLPLPQRKDFASAFAYARALFYYFKQKFTGSY